MEKKERIVILIQEGPQLLPEGFIKHWEMLKEAYPDVIILLRLDDDYIALQEDAMATGPASRQTIIEQQGIAFCSFPYLWWADVISKLVKMGNKVALCDPLQDPKDHLFT